MPPHPTPLISTWGAIICVALGLGSASQRLRPNPLPWIESRANLVQEKAFSIGIPTNTAEEVHRILDEGTHLVLDARPPELFAMGHLPTSLSFPYALRDQAYQDFAPILTPDQRIIVYCSESTCDEALELGRWLKEMGHENTTLFIGGVAEWMEMGYPLSR